MVRYQAAPIPATSKTMTILTGSTFFNAAINSVKDKKALLWSLCIASAALCFNIFHRHNPAPPGAAQIGQALFRVKKRRVIV